MIRFSFLVLAFTCWSFLPIGFAQEAAPFSDIHLTEGGFFKGQVLTHDSSGYSSFRLRSGEIVQLKTSTIEQIKTARKNELTLKKGHTISTKGPYMTLQFGFLGGFGSGDFLEPTIATELFSLSVGHQFNKYWQVGGGVAFDFYDHQFIPLFAEAKYFLRPEKRMSIYGGLQTGYSFSFTFDTFSNNQYGGGALVHPAVGLRFASKKKSSFLLEVGNRYQWGTVQNNNRISIDRIIYRRLSLRVGWQF